MTLENLRRACRACGGTLDTVLCFDDLALSAFPRPGDEPPRLRVPLDLCQCLDCRLVQLRHTVPADLMFQQYWYRSGINETMRAELADIVETAQKFVDLRRGDTVVDIGANDGTLFANYPEGVFRIAYEPAENLQAELQQHCDAICSSYFPQLDSWSAKVITSIACFYDVDDPHVFVQAIADRLAPDGIWIVQFQDLWQMLRATAFDNLCLPGEERLITERGLRAIEQIRVGDFVLTHQGQYHAVVNTFSRQYTGDLIELTAYGFGYALRTTPDHPIYVNREGQWQWVAAEAVVHGDIVARPILTRTTTLTEIPCRVGDGRRAAHTRMIPLAELTTLFGYYLAEGSIASNGDVLFYFGPHESQLAGDCHRRIVALGFAARIRRTATTLAVQAHGPLARLLEAHCGRGASRKHLSALLLALPPVLAEELLRAYVAGDGYEYRNYYLRASTVSEQLALDIAMLANRVGWKASITEQARPATCVIDGRVVAQLPLWDILIHTKPKLRQKVWLDSGYQCGRIRRIARVPYSGTVFNLEVEHAGTYVSPAMTLHNCHEHLVYYSLASVERLIAPHGLQVIDAQRRAINGGSYRLIVRRGGPVSPSVTALRLMERDCEHWETLHRFAWRVGEATRQITGAVEAAQAAGQTVDLYGASTKGNTLLQVCGLGPTQIRQAWERSPAKYGRQTVTGIPIVAEAEGRADPPDLLLAAIWQFRDHLLAREADYLAGGGRILFPLPRVEIVEGRREC